MAPHALWALRHGARAAARGLAPRRSLSSMADVRDPLAPKLAPFRRTKIVCTVGPATWSDEGISGLLDAGMNVMRINCSHGDHALYERVIKTLRDQVHTRDTAASHLLESVNVSCAVALDTKGPEVRLGDFAEAGHKGVAIKKGDKVALSVNPDNRSGMTKELLFVDYGNLGKSLSKGSKVYVDDGLLSLVVEEIQQDDSGLDVVQCIAENSAQVGSRKGVNLPGAVLDLPAVSKKDRADLEFARAQAVDLVFASFVRRAEHVREIREILGPDIGIVAKIENAEGLRNIDEIIEEADGVMVARGDLGIEIPQENVFLAQKWMVAKANLRGKPVICATQMLDSMTRSPRPTRAECADTANAVLDGCDAVMLSGETANGEYPELTVRTMARICQTAEHAVDHKGLTDTIRTETRGTPNKPICEALVVSAVVAAEEENAKLMLVLSETGISARIAAKYRPSSLILCITSNQATARQLQLTYGTRVHAVPGGMPIDAAIESGLRQAAQWGLVSRGDRVVAVHSQGSVMRLLDCE